MNAPCAREFPSLKPFLAAALVVGWASSARAQIDITSSANGNWSSPTTWTPQQTPVATDIVHVTGGFTVNYTSGSSGNMSRVYVGDQSSTNSSGTLNVSGGVLSLNRNDASALSIGRSANSTGALNISGGAVLVGTTATTGMQVAYGANSGGTVTITSGSLRVTNGVVVGAGDGSTGRFTVAGGTVDVFSVNSGPFSIGNRVADTTTTGIYEQTAGVVTVHESYFGVGYAGGASQDMHASASITGGTFSANVRVGRASSVASGGGAGTLLIGSEANVSGRNESWLIGATGELILQLGENNSFNSINLGAATATTAMTFSAGSKLTIDGSELVFSSIYPPITLITWADGKRPTTSGVPLVTFTGFDPQFATPTLVWGNTGLQLQLSAIPEPTTTAMLLGAGALGWVVFRRRRSQN